MIALVPLDAQIVGARLRSDEFRLEREIDGRAVTLHFGPEFPGEAIVLYERYLELMGDAGVVDGTFVIVDSSGEVLGQIGTLGPPVGDEVEVGYGINESARGRGVATAALALLVADLRSRQGVGAIVARCLAANTASCRVLAKNDFTVVGTNWGDEGEEHCWVHAPQGPRLPAPDRMAGA